MIWSVDGVRSLEFAEPRLTNRNQFSCTATLVLEGDDDERSGTLTIRPEDIGRVRDELLQFLSLPAELR